MDTASLSINQAKQWLERHSKRTVENDNADFEKLVAKCELVASSNEDTISETLARMRLTQPIPTGGSMPA